MFIRKKAVLCLLAIGGLTMAAPSTLAQDENQNSAVRDISNIEVDKQQLRQAVSSRTLTWLTGNSSNNDYVSVGRLANFFGFVALRVSSGHSLSRGRVAKETLITLNAKQRAELILLVQNQKDSFESVKTTRHKMNRALEGLLVGEQISREEFLELGRAYGASEAELGRVIGQSLGRVSYSLTPKQEKALMNIREKHISGQNNGPKIKGIKTKLSKNDKKELVNIAARLLSWTTGNETFNDFEVVGKPSQHFGFVSLRIESNHGVKRSAVANEVWELLSKDQQHLIDIAAEHNINAFDEFMSARKQLMRTLEVALEGQKIDKALVEKLGQKMGEAEADMTWAQAMAMLQLRETMSETQLTALLDMRAKYTGKGGGVRPEDPISRGRQLFAQCSLCHSDKNAIAPNLTNIIGRQVASDATFKNYSHAMKEFAASQDLWSESLLDDFLKSPRTLIPGTVMGYGGLEGVKDREAIIAYLKTRE